MEDVHEERPTLRALTIGEIFDRAVTMYVRNFVVFTLIVLTLLVPISVLQSVYTDKAGESFAKLMQQIAHPGTSIPPYDASQLTALVGIALIVLLLAPFTNNAVAVGVAAIYAGRKPGYRDGFMRVFARWGPLLGTSVLSMLILIATYVAMAIGLALLAVFGLALTRAGALVALGIVLALIGMVLFLAAVVLFILFVICCVFALYATTIEMRMPGDAIGEAFRRIFTRRELPKAVLIALAYLALEIGVLILSGVIGVFILDVAHTTVLQVAAGTIINAVLTAFLSVLIAVYYYDVRTRTEGLDLEVALERLTAPA